MRTVVVFVILIANSLCYLGASQISFKAEPTKINYLTTKQLTLRCSVREAVSGQISTRSLVFPRMNYTTKATPTYNTSSTHSSTSIVFTKTATSQFSTTTSPTSGSTSTATNSSEPPTSTTPNQNVADVSHVTSIVISKVSNLTNQPLTVADVTSFESAAVDQAFLGSVTAEGDSKWSPVPGEKAYLQVTWPDPNEDQAGEYTCEVAGLNAHNHPVNMMSSLTITSHDPTLADVINYVTLLEKRLEDATATRVQKGTEECHLNTFTGSQTVRFASPFKSAPTVWTTFSDVRYSSSTDGEFKVAFIGANGSHFTYDCLAAHTSFTFDWLAIGD